MTEPTLREPALSKPTLTEPTLSKPTLSKPTLTEPTLSKPTLPTPLTETRTTSDLAVDEILRLRKAMGSPFRGTALAAEGDGDDAAAFADQLRRQAQVPRPPTAGIDRLQLPPLPQLESPPNLGQERGAGHSPGSPVGSIRRVAQRTGDAVGRTLGLVEQLRESSAQLDAEANVRERQRAFARARGLRRLAHRLRKEARALESGAEAGAGGEAGAEAAPQTQAQAPRGARAFHAPAQTLPSPYYLEDDVQYFPRGPEFKLSREAAAKRIDRPLD